MPKLSTRKKVEPPSISLEGGPKSPKSWQKWRDDGGVQITDRLTQYLEETGYGGVFVLRGVQGHRGIKGNKGCNLLRFREVNAGRNCIELDAQLGSSQSRWRYELSAADKGVDIVDLFDVLKAHHESACEAESQSANDQPESEVVESKVPESQVVDLHPGIAESPTEDSVADADEEVEVSKSVSLDHSTTAPAAGEFDQVSGVATEMQNLEAMAAAYGSAENAATEAKAEIARLESQIAEMTDMLTLYQEDLARAMEVLDSDVHQKAAGKLAKIRAILSS